MVSIDARTRGGRAHGGSGRERTVLLDVRRGSRWDVHVGLTAVAPGEPVSVRSARIFARSCRDHVPRLLESEDMTEESEPVRQGWRHVEPLRRRRSAIAGGRHRCEVRDHVGSPRCRRTLPALHLGHRRHHRAFVEAQVRVEQMDALEAVRASPRLQQQLLTVIIGFGGS